MTATARADVIESVHGGQVLRGQAQQGGAVERHAVEGLERRAAQQLSAHLLVASVRAGVRARVRAGVKVKVKGRARAQGQWSG